MLAASQLYILESFFQFLLYFFAVIALYLDDAIFDRAAGATQGFKILREGFQIFCAQIQTANKRYAFSLPSL